MVGRSLHCRASRNEENISHTLQTCMYDGDLVYYELLWCKIKQGNLEIVFDFLDTDFKGVR